MQMKLAVILFAATLLLPAHGWALIESSVPFYVFDGTSYDVLFMLPATYFVGVGKERDGYTEATFCDLEGYVRTSDVTAADYEPLVKYPETGSVTLKKSVSSVWLYSDASLSNVVARVSATDEIFLYGESASGGVYYVRVGTGGFAERGYLSGEAVDVTPPDENDVAAVAPSQPDYIPPEESGEEQSDPLSAVVRVILIVSVTVPAFLLAFLLSRKT